MFGSKIYKFTYLFFGLFFLNMHLLGFKIEAADELFSKKEISKSELIGSFVLNSEMYNDKRVVEFKEDGSFIYQHHGPTKETGFIDLVGYYHIQNDRILFTIDESKVYNMNNEGQIIKKLDYKIIKNQILVPIIMYIREYKGVLCLLDGLSYSLINQSLDFIKKEQELELFFYEKDNKRRSNYVFLKQ